jgi:hypothetical protein
VSNVLFPVRISRSVNLTDENDALICLTIAMTALSSEGRKGNSVYLFSSPSLCHNGLLLCMKFVVSFSLKEVLLQFFRV